MSDPACKANRPNRPSIIKMLFRKSKHPSIGAAEKWNHLGNCDEK